MDNDEARAHQRAMRQGTGWRRQLLGPMIGLTLATTACTVPEAPTTEPAPVSAGVAVDADRIVGHLEALAAVAEVNGGIRASGTAGYDASADYVADQLEAYGYDVDRQELTFPFFSEDEPVRVEIGGGDAWAGDEWLHALLYSASGDVSGRLVAVGVGPGGAPIGDGACDPEGWAGVRAGDIAVAGSGPCLRRQQVELAQAAGASAMIATYPSWGRGETRRPTLIAPDGIQIPVIAAGAEPAAALVDAALDHDQARVVAHTSVEPRTTTNVVAERVGTTTEVVMIGAHLDSVLDGPGINDNGSGVAALLELSRSVADGPAPDRTVRFAFWAAEEFGVVGSTAYTEGLGAEDLDAIVAYLNLDMLASRNPGRYVYDEAGATAGSHAISEVMLAHLERLGTPGLPTDLHGSSDHGPFQRVGIPTGGIFSGASEPMPEDDAQLFGGDAGEPMDRCYHLACDGLGEIDEASLVSLTGAAGALLIELASSDFELAPDR